MNESRDALDDIVHQRTRLAIMAVLAEAGKAQFSFLKETLGLSDGNLSRHLMILEEAGLVCITKGYEGRRPRTWASVTTAGKRAFRDEIAALKRIVARFDVTNDTIEKTMSSRVTSIRADQPGRTARISTRAANS